MSRKSRALDIDENLDFQQREWMFQRVGIALLFAFVIAAALGATGAGGVLSRGHAGSREGPVFVEFERFVRRGAPATITVHLRTAPGTAAFWVSEPYFDHVRVNTLAPPLQQPVIEHGRHVYSLRATSSEATITLEVEHQTSGRVDGEIGLVNGPSVRFSQFAFF